MRFECSRKAARFACTLLGHTCLRVKVNLPESAETFRGWNISFPPIEFDHGCQERRKESEVAANHRIKRSSPPPLAGWFSSAGTEGLLLAEDAAFSLDSASNDSGGGKDGPGTLEPKAFHRGRSGSAHRNLPRPLARSRTQQAPRQACPGSLSRGRWSREVALHEFRPDDSHGSASALPALVSPPQKFSGSVSPKARICISTPR